MITRTNHGGAIPLPEPETITPLEDETPEHIEYCIPCREEGCVNLVDLCQRADHMYERAQRAILASKMPGYWSP